MEQKKESLRQLRDRLKREALAKALEGHEPYSHFWDALLIHNMDNVIDSIECLQGDISSVESAIESASKSADKLSRRVFWLNIILILIGALSLAVVGYEVFFK